MIGGCVSAATRVPDQDSADHISDPWLRAPIPSGLSASIPSSSPANSLPRRARHMSIRPAPDGHPPLPPANPVVEGEGPVTRGVACDLKSRTSVSKI